MWKDIVMGPAFENFHNLLLMMGVSIFENFVHFGWYSSPEIINMENNLIGVKSHSCIVTIDDQF